MPQPAKSKSPAPAPVLYDEGPSAIAWLASDFSREDIADEWDYKVESPDALREVWYRFRWTTPEELADEDLLYDLFGDWENNGFDTSAYCDRAKPGSPGAHRYWTIEP